MGPYLMPHFDAEQIDQHAARLDRPLRRCGRATPTTPAAGGSTTSGRSPRGWSPGSSALAALVIVARLIGERIGMKRGRA